MIDPGSNEAQEGLLRGSCEIQEAGKRQEASTAANPQSTAVGNETRTAAEKNGHQATGLITAQTEGEDQEMQENEQNTFNTKHVSRNNTQKEYMVATQCEKNSSIQWSPMKLAGTKRALEEDCEEAESPAESEDDKEEGELSDNEDNDQESEEEEQTSPRDRETSTECGSRHVMAEYPQVLQTYKEVGITNAREERDIAEKPLPQERDEHGDTGAPKGLRARDAAPNDVEASRTARHGEEVREVRQEEMPVTERNRGQLPDPQRNGNIGPLAESEEDSWGLDKLPRLTQGKAMLATDTVNLSDQVRLPPRGVTQHLEEIRATGRPKELEGRRTNDTIKDTNPADLPQSIVPEVILETQFHQYTKDRGKFYNEIMASIGLDSPTTSREDRGGEDSYQETGNQLATTPIRNSAANLMALGKHVLTPRQGRMWEFKGKSPFGG